MAGPGGHRAGQPRIRGVLTRRRVPKELQQAPELGRRLGLAARLAARLRPAPVPAQQVPLQALRKHHLAAAPAGAGKRAQRSRHVSTRLTAAAEPGPGSRKPSQLPRSPTQPAWPAAERCCRAAQSAGTPHLRSVQPQPASERRWTSPTAMGVKLVR